MLFCFDESGDFAIPQQQGEHKAAVVMGVAISDVIHDELRTAYEQFKQKLRSSEFVDGEPKGRRLKVEHQLEFCELLARFDGVSLTPVTLDLSHLASVRTQVFPNRMHDLLCKQAELMAYDTAKGQLRHLARQFRNLHYSQMLRLHALANCISEALQHALIFLSHGDHRDSWNKVSIEIDRVQARAYSREERIFSTILYAWMAGWSKSKPFSLVEGIHTPDHPFVKNFNTDQGIEISKMLRGNIKWVDSRFSWAVQIADISAAIVYKAVADLDDRFGAATRYASLMRSSHYGHRRGPGLFTPLEASSGETAAKYMVLSEVMKRNRRDPS